MTKHKHKKQLVRARMARTNEKYRAALAKFDAGPPGRFETIVRRSIELAERWRVEEGEKPHQGDVRQEFRALLAPPGPHQARLLEHLEAQSEPDLVKLQTIMYLGRGDDDDVLRLHRYLVHLARTKDSRIESISEKVPLAKYLSDGLAFVKSSGVNLEGDWQKIAPPQRMFWLALEHPCGCCIDWGVDDREQSRLAHFLGTAVDYPCPWHGSATGKPTDADREQTVHLVSANVWYRVASASQKDNARRNIQVARSFRAMFSQAT